jgi:hypothetical protein
MSTGIVIFFLATGCAGGFLAGLLGVGGGILFVPCLHYGFTRLGLGSDLAFLMAVGTSLAIIVVTSLSSTLGHAFHGSLAGRQVFAMATLAIPGSLAGAALAQVLGGDLLRRLFGVFLFYVAYRFLRPAPEAQISVDRNVSFPELAGVGGASGLFSAILGVGGGLLTVPLLNLLLKVPMRKAVANSSGLIVFTAIGGTAGWIYSGWEAEGLPPHSFGYVNAVAWALISFTSVLFAQLGAWTASRMKPEGLAKPFAAVLCLVGIKMIFF